MPQENTERKPKRWRQHPALPALLAALLAFVMVLANHSWSKFYTGSWDGYSELLAVGRITQLQQGQSAPGGFLGVYTAEWGDGEGYALLKDNTPQSPETYKSYVHQSGLQGTLAGGLARVLCRVPSLSGEGRLNVLYFVNCWLFYLLAVRLCLALAGYYGTGAGLGALPPFGLRRGSPWEQKTCTGCCGHGFCPAVRGWRWQKECAKPAGSATGRWPGCLRRCWCAACAALNTSLRF